MLFLVVHTVEAPSAKVPLSVIILNDLIKRRSIPPELKIRMVSAGARWLRRGR